MGTKCLVVLLFALSLMLPWPTGTAFGGWQDAVKGVTDEIKKIQPEEETSTQTSSEQESSTEGSSTSLTESEIDSGLREALELAVDTAVSQLGQEDGFMGNSKVQIPLPSGLSTAESVLRGLGQDELVDDFLLSMNRAAEQAVPETVDVFASAIQQMTMKDAAEILAGDDDAATQYFERTSRDKLQEKILPIVKEATDANNVTSYYKNLTTQAQGAATLTTALGGTTDLDEYVTEKALDGLFLVMAEQEAQIRENPAARATELLQKVFGD